MNSNNFFHSILLGLSFFVFSWGGVSQSGPVWTKKEAPSARANLIEYSADFKNFDTYILDRDVLDNVLENAPFRFGSTKSNLEVEFPIKGGDLEKFVIYQTAVMSPVLAEKYPAIKTFTGTSSSNSGKQINLTLTPYGVYAMILHNRKTIFINPIHHLGEQYMVFNKNHAHSEHLPDRICHVQGESDEDAISTDQLNQKIVNNTTLKRYRLALAATSSYSNFHVNQAGLPPPAPTEERLQAVLSAMVVTINRVNAIYERDLSISLQLIDNTDSLIQLNSATDPYTNDDVVEMLSENQTQIDATIGSANYDIGHVFSTAGGGVAALGSVCNFFFKANGVTGLPSPVGDSFDVDYVAHEMGHQFGANHTFNNNCFGNRNNATAVEPGSGSTIMGYANVCSPNVQSFTDDYFHLVSINEIHNFVNASAGASCSENISIGNNPPTIDVPLEDYFVPVNTPFVLEVEASDADGDVLTYAWEQLDNEIATQPPLPTNNNGPNFRTLQPKLSPKRYFPDLNTVLNASTNTWEVLPSVSRQMNFGVLVRDNNEEGGQSNFDSTELTFVAGDAFEVTSQNIEGIVWEEGDTETITWNVGNTDVAPIYATEVDILLSTNIGFDFDVVLATNVPNTGSAEVVVPDVFAPSCRVMVKASNNVFYSVNPVNFSINSSVNLECFEEVNSTVVEIPDGLGANQPGTVVSSSINFDQNLIIETLKVEVDISHTYIQDLVIQLIGPDGEFVTLFNRNCGNEDGIMVQFDDAGESIPEDCPNPLAGTFMPADGDLNQWLGSNGSGEWTLVMADFWNGDVGQLNSWSIEICSSNLSTVQLEANQFSIIPNPNQGQFQINFSNLMGAQLEGKLYNMQGRLVETIQLQPGMLRQEVQFDNLQHGMYLFEINDGTSNRFVEKLIIR